MLSLVCELAGALKTGKMEEGKKGYGLQEQQQ